LLSDGKIICKVCPKTINFDEKHINDRVEQHLKTAKHKEDKNGNKGKQCSIINFFDQISDKNQTKDKFYSELTEAFLYADIPLEKLKNEKLKNFLFEYTNQNIPHLNTLRDGYVQNIYEEKLNQIWHIIGENKVYFIIDDTTDSSNRYVFNALVGILNGFPSKAMLISTQFLEIVNSSTINQALNKACQLIWP